MSGSNDAAGRIIDIRSGSQRSPAERHWVPAGTRIMRCRECSSPDSAVYWIAPGVMVDDCVPSYWVECGNCHFRDQTPYGHTSVMAAIEKWNSL